MSEPAEQTTEQPKPPRKQRKRRGAVRKVVPFKAPEEFAGMTETECCSACKMERCVISGVGFCGHPFKGGQIPQGDQAALERLNRAKKALARRKLDPQDA